jgi:hypothetical protein
MNTKSNTPAVKAPKTVKAPKVARAIEAPATIMAPPIVAPPLVATPPAPAPVLRRQFVKVQLKLSCPSAKRVNKDVAQDAEDKAGALRGSVSAGNKLFPGGDLNAITSFDQTLRGKINAMTTPLSDGGERLLPTAKFAEISQIVREAMGDRESLVSDFLATYETRVETAKENLGTLFNDAFYPSVEAMKEKFNLRFFYDKWQDTQLDSEIESAIATSRDEALKDGERIALSEMASRLFAPLTGPAHTVLAGIAKGKDCSTKDNVVTRLAGMANVLDELNAYGDPTISEIANDLRATFSGTDRITASKLRTDSDARKVALAKLEAIKAKFGI